MHAVARRCVRPIRVSTGRAFLYALLIAVSSLARNGSEPLNHYGLVALSDSAVGNRLAARFKAKGHPVFLVHDISLGLSRNDIMRFSDRVVLVDDDVWSTLRVEGALAKIRTSPIIRVQGRANAASWTERAEMVSDVRQRKGFRLGAEILRVLEDNFGGSPQENQMTLVFDQGRITLLASATLMDQLALFPVRRVEPDGRPRIVSVPPDTNQFTRRPFEFRIWAVDPGDPAGTLEPHGDRPERSKPERHSRLHDSVSGQPPSRSLGARPIDRRGGPRMDLRPPPPRPRSSRAGLTHRDRGHAPRDDIRSG
jgi:hypothetical protein